MIYNYMVRKILICLWVGILCLTVYIPKSHAEGITDSQAKAAWIYTIIDWLEWKTRPNEGNITICTIGKDRVYSYLLEMKRQQKYTHEIVKKFPEGNFERCHILYISTSEQDHFDDLLKKVNGYSIVTVSSIQGFAKRGGMVEFVMKKKVWPRINLTTANNAKITIDSQLRNWAETIR